VRAADFRLDELIQRDASTGFPVIHDNRLMMIGLGALGRVNQEMLQGLDLELVEAIFTRMGYENGLALGLVLADTYDWDSREELLRAGVAACAMAGAAVADLDELVLEPDGALRRFRGRWRQSFEAQIQLESLGPSAEPVCCMLSGLASGLASVALGQEIWVRELYCQAQGHDHCAYEGRPIADWGLDPAELRRRFSLERLDDDMARLRERLDAAQRDLAAKQAELARLRPAEAVASGVLHRSKAMGQVLALAAKVAPTASTVLIGGESGVGKEVLARFIHQHSGRQAEPFLAINCAALPATLLESELFGHVKGAFTGAEADKPGLFLEAGRGTVFLDEVGELPLELQAKLLRALQEKEIRPVGGLKSRPVRARIIAASNRDLAEMVGAGRLREDLYYRLAVFPLVAPPLRQRREDILLLARHFLEKLAPGHPGLAPATVRKMEAHAWPGNVRELENAVEHAVILAGNELIQPEHLPQAVGGAVGAADWLAGDMPSQDELLRRYTKLVLQATGGNRSQAARMLGIGVNTLWRRLKQWDMG